MTASREWTVRESEYATDVLFRNRESLGAIYPALLRHAMEQFHTEDVLRFLGRKTTITRFNGEVRTCLERRIEGVRIKHWVEENWIKMYDKYGIVLRIETTINNPRRFKVRRRTTRKGQPRMGWLRMRKGVVDIRRRVQLSRAANERYLEALSVVGTPNPSCKLLDPVSQPQLCRGRRYRPLRPIRRHSHLPSCLAGSVLTSGLPKQGYSRSPLARCHKRSDREAPSFGSRHAATGPPTSSRSDLQGHPNTSLSHQQKRARSYDNSHQVSRN